MNLLGLGLALALQTPTDRPIRDEAARAHYRENRFPQAAAAFESLWHEFHAPKYLYNAGLAREGMGHDAHAIVHWQRFLELSGLSDKERAKAQTKLDEAVKRTTPVSIDASPSDAMDDAILTIQRTGSYPTPLNISPTELTAAMSDRKWLHLEPGIWTIGLVPGPERSAAFEEIKASISISRGQEKTELLLKPRENLTTLQIRLHPHRVRRASASITLREPGKPGNGKDIPLPSSRTSARVRAGRWEYTVTATGFRAKTARIDLQTAQVSKLTLRLQRDGSTMDPRDRNARLGLALGLGFASLATGIPGAVLWAIKKSDMSKLDCDIACTADESENYANLANGKFAGIGLAGASMGLAIGSITSSSTRNPRLWPIEMTVGAASGLGAAILLATTNSGPEPWTEIASGTASYQRSKEVDTRFLAGSLLAGLGSALVLSTATKLIVNRLSTSSRSLRAFRRHNIKITGTSLRANF